MNPGGICPHARREAIKAYKQRSPEPLVTEDMPRSAAERQSKNNELKPAFYGLVGKAVARIIETAIETPLTSKPNRLPSIRRGYPKLHKDFYHRFDTASAEVLEADRKEPYMAHLLGAYTVMRQVNPRRHDTLNESISGGVTTAGRHVLGHLESLAIGAKALGIENATTVLRRSHGVIIEAASMNELQVTVAGSSLEYGYMPPVEHEPTTNRLQYSTRMSDMPVTEADAYLLKDIARCHVDIGTSRRDITADSDTIGCPILFEPGQIKDLWNWTIDAAIDRGLITD